MYSASAPNLNFKETMIHIDQPNIRMIRGSPKQKDDQSKEKSWKNIMK